MATIENQIVAPPGVKKHKCPLCDAMDVKKTKYDELRRRIAAWEDQLRYHEKDDAAFTLEKCYNQYICMVADSRSAQQQQSCAKDKKDIVRYHTMSPDTFAQHFLEPHLPTREIRNVQKNDAIESLYSTHLELMHEALRQYKAERKESDLKSYSELAKTMRVLNDVSVSPRFLPFHTVPVRKSIHK